MPTKLPIKNILVILFPAVLAVLIIFFIVMSNAGKDRQPEPPRGEPVETPAPVTVNSFEECVSAGNPVMESYPRQCRHENRLFVEDIAELSQAERLQVEAYIREHISELSPESAVLGGTFYVTDVRFLPNREVLVDYEDGHIALRAYGLFSFDPDGSIRVERFDLSKLE